MSVTPEEFAGALKCCGFSPYQAADIFGKMNEEERAVAVEGGGGRSQFRKAMDMMADRQKGVDDTIAPPDEAEEADGGTADLSGSTEDTGETS